MKPDSFEKQFPGYKLIPEKKNRWIWPLIWVSFAIFAVGIPLLLLKALSLTVPTPRMAASNKFTLPTIRALAMQQSARENHSEALLNFERYFALGGAEADMMAMYAYTLLELGRRTDAEVWAKKAAQADPESKAAKLIRDALETK